MQIRIYSHDSELSDNRDLRSWFVRQVKWESQVQEQTLKRRLTKALASKDACERVLALIEQ